MNRETCEHFTPSGIPCVKCQTLVSTGIAKGCYRSHPHENMDATCERYTQYERELASLRAGKERAEAERDAALKDAELGKAIERAAKDLPEGVDLEIALERGAGTVRLYLPDSDAAITDFGCDIPFHAEINAAIDAAIAARKGEQ